MQIVEPAPFLATRELFQTHALLKPDLALVATVQLLTARTIGLLDDAGSLVAAAILWPYPLGVSGVPTYELATVNRSPAVMRPYLLPALRHLRSTLDALAYHERARVLAHVRHDNPVGRRAAGLLGFRLTGQRGAFQQWEKPWVD